MRVWGRGIMAWALCVVCMGAVQGNVAASEDGVSDPASRRIWIEPDAELPDEQTQLHVVHGTEYRPDDEIIFDCNIETEHYLDRTIVRLDVTDEDGELVHRGELHLDIEPGSNPARFSWTPDTLPPGTYTARIEASRMIEGRLVAKEFIVRHYDERLLREAFAEAAAETTALRNHFDAIAERGPVPPYAALRMTIAEDFLRDVEEAIVTGDWRWADAVTQYITETCHRIRADLTFGGATTWRRRPIPDPRLDALAAEGAALTAETRPVFLIGARIEDPEDISHLKRYGMNLAVVDFGPGRGDAYAESRLDALFEAAAEHNVLIMPMLGLDRLMPISADYGCSEALDAVKRHIETVGPRLAARSMLGPVELATAPRFRFEGPDIRESFIQHMAALFDSRDDLNNIWRSRLLSMNDIRPFWDYNVDSPDFVDSYTLRAAYQYDWQRFHQRLGTAFMQRIRDAVEETLPEALFQVGLANDVFESAESIWGVDREALLPLFPVAGAATTASRHHPVYAVGHPSPAIYYALLNSIASDAPKVSAAMGLSVDPAPHAKDRFAQAYTLLWQAAINGADAIAIDDLLFPTEAGGVFSMPEVIEAAGTARFDLNRLSEIVHAFQNAPTDVAILWSMPSKILDDGSPYLSSAVNAYEGASFFGWNVQFISEAQCVAGKLAEVPVLVLPHMLSVSDEAFDAIEEYIDAGGKVIRWGRPILYDERGISRRHMLTRTPQTIMLRGEDMPRNYLHAVDATYDIGRFDNRPRPVNRHDYPLEGVISRSVWIDGEAYLYMVNIRREPVFVHLYGGATSGRDLIQDQEITFPTHLSPLRPMLLHIAETMPDIPVVEPRMEGLPSAVVGPLPPPIEEEGPTSRRNRGTRR